MLYKNDEESIDKVLGTLSVQRIFFILAIWEKLAVTEIITKTELSESIIHQSLKKLSDHRIVEKISRGIYALSSNPTTEYLKKFYSQILIEHVGSELYRISKSIETEPIEQISSQIDELLLKWKPLIEEHYSFRVSSLVGAFIERSVYEGNVINE